jgi:lysophospholipase L1-like esterase
MNVSSRMNFRALVRFTFFLLPLTGAAQDPAPDLAASPAADFARLDPALPTIFIAGDSTAAKAHGNPLQGWGEPFADFFDRTKINVANRARGGRSSRTFITEGHWDQVLAEVKAGDTVLIQFGHNDGGAINGEPPGSTRPLRARGSLPGLGEESAEIDNLVTHRRETVRTFGWYVRKMIADVKAKGAAPILLSLTIRDRWSDGKIERSSGRYRSWSREIAAQAGVPFVDLSRIIADQYQIAGPKQVGELFGPDHTHTNVAGAAFNAAGVVAGLKGLRPSRKYEGYFSASGRTVEPDVIGWLSLPEPAEPKRPSILLIGDSTVRNGRGDGAGGQWGWGDFLGSRFDPEKVNLVNRAVGGLSSRTFRTQGHWRRALMLIKPGDIVLIQFGHNDAAALNDAQRARGTIKGTGEETEAIDNLLTKLPEVVHSYGWYLRKYVREARAAGATPVVCSLVPRKIWQDGRVARAAESYGGWAGRVAAEEGAAFLDLNELVAARYEAEGEAKVNALFADEHTHSNREGAELNAAIVTAALRALPGDPFGAWAR